MNAQLKGFCDPRLLILGQNSANNLRVGSVFRAATLRIGHFRRAKNEKLRKAGRRTGQILRNSRQSFLEKLADGPLGGQIRWPVELDNGFDGTRISKFRNKTKKKQEN